MTRRFFPAVVIWTLAASSRAQDVQIGYPPYLGVPSQVLNAVGVETFVNLSSPASATGTVDTGWLGWASAGPCPAAVKVKIFRRRAEMLLVVAERGPLDVSPNEFGIVFKFQPPIEVEQGDFLGFSRVSDCGQPYIYFAGPGPEPTPTEGLARFEGDVTSDVAVAAGHIEGSGFFLGVFARGPATEQIERILPVAGSTPGAFGSYFRTALQLSNPSATPLEGRLVFHPSGPTSSPNDPSLPFVVGAFSTFTNDDIVAAMGETGIGTLDVVVPTLTGVPLITARVYADAPDGGTFGFTQETIDPICCGFLSIGTSGYLIAPTDPRRFRFNIGVRALFKAPTITFRLLGPDGTTVRAVTRSYPPSTFLQEPVEALFGAALPANAQIAVEATAGTAVVYGATVDNVTNDPSIQYVRFY